MKTRHGGSQLPDSRVFAFMGVNGTGKSTITDRLSDRIPGTGVVHASHELRTLFGGISREQQNKMSIEDRMGEIATHLTHVFDQNLTENDRVLFDTQLLVPTPESTDQQRTYESAWSDAYGPYLASAVMFLAPPSTIRAWRYEDGIRTGRERDLSEANIDQDQHANVDYFRQLIARRSMPLSSKIIHNEDGMMEQTEQLVTDHILTT